MKFLHAADIHLDSPLLGLERYEGAPVDLIRGATRRALENLVQLAINERVNFVVIAGDLYDGDWRDFNTGMFFVRQMSLLSDAGIPVFLIAGNHDAANTMTRKLRLPLNPDGSTMLLSHEQAESRHLEDLGIAVHGRSFANQAESRNMVPDYQDPIPHFFNIGLLHTSLNGSDEHDTYAPCDPAELVQKGYQYWALGHIHKRTHYIPSAANQEIPPILFSGNLQGRHVRETGARGCYLVNIEERRATSALFRPLDVFRWEVCKVACDQCKNVDEVLNEFRAQLAKLIEQHGHIPLGIRVLFEGTTKAHQQLASNRENLNAEVRTLATIASAGRVWIEQVKLLTQYQTEPRGQREISGPIAELMNYLDDLPKDDALLQKLMEELKDLTRKLPREVQQAPDGLQLTELDQIREIVREVKPMLLEELGS